MNGIFQRLATIGLCAGVLVLGEVRALSAQTAEPGGRVRPADAPAGRAGREGASTPRGGQRRGLPALRDDMTPQQLDQAFDRFMVAQARGALQLTPDQVGRFGPRLVQLQVARRRAQRERRQLVQELNGLTQDGGAVDETIVAEKLKALDDQAARAQATVRAAYQDIDAVLTPAQRLRFRAFELRMEQRKLELISRARQAARPAAEP
jgi:hypothetical protein